MENEELANKYTRALRIRADVLVEEMINIADDNSADTKLIYDKNGDQIEVEDKEWTNRVRLRLDTRKWIAARMNPKKYGDKVQQEIEVTDKTIKFNFGIAPDEEIEDIAIEE